MKSKDFVTNYLDSQDPEELFDEKQFKVQLDLIIHRLQKLSKVYPKLTHRHKCLVTFRISFMSWISRCLLNGVIKILRAKEDK